MGIVPTSSPSITSGSGTPSQAGKLTSSGDELTLEKLTTSAKSVADYFRDKLLARSSAKSGMTTPVISQTEHEADDYDAPRVGLGSFRSNPEIPKLFSSVPPIFGAPQTQSLHDPVSDVPLVETQAESTSQVTKKKRQEEKYPSDKSAGKETSKYAKGDKKAQKEKKRSQDK